MTKETLFAQKLERIAQTAKEQGNCVSEEQLRETFAELSLGEEQLEMVRTYLKQRSIGIGEPAAPEDYLNEQEIDYLEGYLKQLAELPEVSEGEKEAITLSAMAGDADPPDSDFSAAGCGDIQVICGTGRFSGRPDRRRKRGACTRRYNAERV